MHPLDGSFLKLNRAKAYLKTADELAERFKNRKPYKIATFFEGKGKARECLLRFEKVEDVPVGLSLLIGDICNNLRSALDHLVWQLWLLKYPTFTRNVYFPICDDDVRFNSRSPGDIGKLTIAQKTLIESLQPYRTKNPALSFLRDVNDCDKHRLVQVIGLMVDVNSIAVTPAPITTLLAVPMPIEIKARKLRNSVKVENGAIIARISLDSSLLGINVRVQSHTIVSYAFDGGKSADGKLVKDSLDAMVSEVSRALILFEPEFAQFGVPTFK